MREVNESCLTRCIGDAATARNEPCDRSYVHDSPPSVTTKLWRECSCEQVWSPKIRFEDSVPDIWRQRIEIGERDTNVPSSVVNENVDSAELSEQFADTCINGNRIALVKLDREASSPYRMQRIYCRGCAFAVTDVRDGNIDAGRGQCFRDRASDITCA